MAEVVVNLYALKRFRKLIDDGFDGEAGPIQSAFLAWGPIYRAFVRRRFLKLARSNGGGEWAPLAQSTIMRRRHGQSGVKGGRGKRGVAAFRKQAKTKKGNLISILIDTSTLLGALCIDFLGATAGQIQEIIRGGLKVGIGGPKYHPKAKMTIGALAATHHYGIPGKLPARTILVPPDNHTLNTMARALEAGVAAVKRMAES